MHRFKFADDLAAGDCLADLLARAARRAPAPTALVPVPLAPRRRRQRGFDQALELARGVSRRLSIPVNPRAARRRLHREPQSGLADWALRWRNVHGVFHVKPRAVAGRHLALVDDVMTSGATAGTLAAELLRSGASRVDLWVVCRAGLDG